MRDVDLPDPLQNARGRDDDTALEHGAAVDEGRGIAGDEDENLGGVAEAVIADREPGQKIGRQMIDEDQPQRHPAKQIEPQLALAAATGAKRPAATPAAMHPAAGPLAHDLGARSFGASAGDTPAIGSATDVIGHRVKRA